jgi:hypothetical protein
MFRTTWKPAGANPESRYDWKGCTLMFVERLKLFYAVRFLVVRNGPGGPV